MKTLCLSTDLQEKIRAHCVARYPHEACGLLLGQGGKITHMVPSPNLSDQPTKNFDIDPALIIQHQKAGREGSEQIVGHYHSHPDGQAMPSARDQAQNYDRDLIWVIVQVTDGVAQDIKAFATAPQSGQLTAILLNP